MIIYAIKNKINNKRYIGQTIQQIEKRWYYHKYELNRNIHENLYLQRSWNKYGEDAFELIVIDDAAKTIDELNDLEQKYIVEHKTLDRNFGYNLQSGGKNFVTAKETKKLISENHADVSGENNPMYGKVGELSPIFGENNPMYGKVGELSPIFGKKNPMYGTCAYDIWLKKFGTEEANRLQKETNNKNRIAHSNENNFMYIKRRNDNPYPKLLYRDGTIHEIPLTLKQFANEHNLNKSHLGGIVNGKRKSHKGWTVYKPDAQ